MQNAPADAAPACLPDGRGGHFAFPLPHRRQVARSERDLLALAADLDRPSDDWRVLFVSFEGAVALGGLGPLRVSPDAPAAILWQTGAPRPCPTGPLAPPACRWSAPPTRAIYRLGFERVSEAILAGEVYQLNLTFRLRGEVAAESIQRPPGRPAWSSHLRDPELTLWSRSPECFLLGDLSQGTVRTRPIKGTTAAPVGERMRADPKEHAEHVMIVDMARHDLGAVARTGSVRVERMLDIVDVGYARHLESTIAAELRSGVGLGALLKATLPAASISGTPKRAACSLIAAIEQTPRGPYTGILGWLSPTGALAFAVLIRTVWSTDGSSTHYGTGGGIVADSDGDREYDEALLKTAALHGADAHQ
jgi:anthranilate/para-aminobenzoate synthase component I